MSSSIAKILYSHLSEVTQLVNILKISDFKIIRVVRKNKGITLVEITKKTELTKAYVIARLKVLLSHKILVRKEGHSPRYSLPVCHSTNKLSDAQIEALLSSIKEVYPNHRSGHQPEWARTAFKKEVTKVFKKNRSIEDVEALSEKIKEYISYMRSSHDWKKNDGKYVPGFGNFIKGESWRNPPEEIKPVTDKIGDQIKDLF